MGTIQHKSLVVTSNITDEDKRNGCAFRSIQDIQKKAKQIFGKYNIVSEMSTEQRNGYYTFCVFPDGSHEGWSDSNAVDELIDELIEYIDNLAYDDGSNSFEYVLVEYGERGSSVIQTNCEDYD